MDSPETSKVGSRSSSRGRKRLRDGVSPEALGAASSSGAGLSRKQRKKLRGATQPDVRDFVPSGGTFSSSVAPLAQPNNDGPLSSDSVPPAADTSDEMEEGEIGEGTRASSPIVQESQGDVPGSKGLTPRVNWNGAANTKIRTRLGGLGVAAQGASKPLATMGSASRPIKLVTGNAPMRRNAQPDLDIADTLPAEQERKHSQSAKQDTKPALAPSLNSDLEDSKTPNSDNASRPQSSTSLNNADHTLDRASNQEVDVVSSGDQPHSPDHVGVQETASTQHNDATNTSESRIGQKDFAVVIENKPASLPTVNTTEGQGRRARAASPVSDDESVYSPTDASSRDSTYADGVTGDSEYDSMIQDYSRSDRITLSRDRSSQNRDGPPARDTLQQHPQSPTFAANPARDQNIVRSAPIVKYLPVEAKSSHHLSIPGRVLQRRYLMSDLASFGALAGGDPVSDEEAEDQCDAICLTCGRSGHSQGSCPALQCKHCGSINEHFSHACPSILSCRACHANGHSRATCTAKQARVGGGDDGEACDICMKHGHNEHLCPSIWRSYVPDESNTRKVCRLPMACYTCGSNAHLGVDCRLRGKTTPLMSGGTTFCSENYEKYLDEQSDLTPISIPRPNLSIRGRAVRVSPAFYAETDSEDEPGNFLRAKVDKDRSTHQHIRFSGSQFANANRGPPSEPAGRYPARSHHAPLEDDYRPPPPRGPSSRRGAAPRGLSPPRRHRSPSPRRYDDRPSYRDTRFSDNRGRDDDRGDRWQPPLPREPLPSRPPTGPPRGPRGGKRGRGDSGPRGRGGGRGGGGGGGGGGRPSGDREAYKPMPSAAKNAWKKHRI